MALVGSVVRNRMAAVRFATDGSVVVAAVLLWLGTAPALRAQPERPTLVCTEPSGTLEVHGDVVERVRDGTRQRLGCTDPGGTGAVRDVAVHPDGTIYVAAERGLFVTATGVDVLDRADLRDGVSTAAPVGVEIDARGVLWLATTTALSCVDTAALFGRTFGQGDGLPPPPYLGLDAAENGDLLLRTGDGAHRVRLGTVATPKLTVRAVNGVPWSEGATIVARGPVRLDLHADAAGGATFRYRRVGHHVWEPLDSAAPVVPRLDPGRYELELVALDRELQSSEPVRLRLEVPSPFYYRKGFLVAVTALGVVLVLAWFVWPARRRGVAAVRRAVLSAALATVILLQVVAGIAGHAKSWPFVGFSMYTERYHEGSLIYKPVVVGIGRDGTRWELPAWWSGEAYTSEQAFVALAFGGRDDWHHFVTTANRLHPDRPLRGIRVQSNRYRLTAHGPVRVAPLVQVHWEEPQ